MLSDTKCSQVLVQEVWFTFSRSERIMEFPGQVRSRERETLWGRRGGAGGCAAFVSLEADGGVCVVALVIISGFFCNIYPSVLFYNKW